MNQINYKIFNFIDDSDTKKTDIELFITIIKNFYYNNDFPSNEEQEKMKQWFQLTSTNEINKFLSNIKDEEYDQMIEIVKINNINTDNNIGSLPYHKKYELPVFMGSLDKIKNENDYLSWKNKYNINEIIITEKLDGISALLIINRNEIKLCTRGNGKIGCDISHIIPYMNINKQIKQIKKTLDNVSNLNNVYENDYFLNYPIYIRGELIIENINKNETNLRNIVSGIVHTKEITNDVKSKLKLIDFVSYRLYDSNKDFSSQLLLLNKLAFKIPQYNIVKNNTFSEIKHNLQKFVENSLYQIDGIVISYNIVYNRDPIYKNPDHSIALKNISKSIETEVIEVEWNVSKHGIYKPRIKVKPISINGANIEWVTGFNAKYILDNRIGYGSILEIERSGDVIPNIKSVIKSTEAELPKNEWIWNKTGVNICIKETNNREMEIKKILTFFQELECPYLGPKTIEIIYDIGFSNIQSFLNITKKDLINSSKYKDKSADNILQGLNICKENLYNFMKNKQYILMYASGCFGLGIGSKKIKLILDNFPNIVNEYNVNKRDEWIKNIKSIKGIFDLAELFVDNIDKYKQFNNSIKTFMNLNDNKQDLNKVTFENSKKLLKIIFKLEKITFSGFRDKELQNLLEFHGNIIDENVTKSTTIVIYKDNDNSSKCKKAKNMGIKLFEVNEVI
jgi:DNA ligase (NAD+)